MNLSLGDNLQDSESQFFSAYTRKVGEIQDSESQFLSAYTRKVGEIRKNNTTSKLYNT